MAIAFTPEQEKVIQLHNRNILVSAAAGSGKTAVLVERIVRMVCDGEHPVDIDRLLIVTFTNAAAAEMRERIAAGIAARLQENPESEHIQRQSALLHNAQITTIDSFCLFIIRNHFHEIGIDPAFRIADENEVKLLEQEVLAGLLEEAYASGDADFIYCVEFFCPGGRESVLENYILSLSHHAASCPYPEEWLLERKGDYSAQTAEELLKGGAGHYLKRYIDGMLEGCISKLKEVQAVCESPDGPYMYGEVVDEELEKLQKLKETDSLEDYAANIPNFTFARLPAKKDESVSVSKRERAKKLRAKVKDILQGIGSDFFQTPIELAAEQSESCAPAVNTLIDLVLEFDRRMQKCKLERKMIDFSDMEHYALKILLDKTPDGVAPSRVAKEYSEHFHEILIDEYQDSNLVQEYLLKAVSRNSAGQFNRFMVGDVKQSIYRFRLARPELFLDKYEHYEENGETGCRIDLSRNFRSRPQVVDTVNSVFGRIMSRRTGGIEYDDRAALYAGAVYPESTGCESEMILVDKPDREDDLNAKQAEALAIAGKIKELKKNFRITDRRTGELRPALYSDMVILLRANYGWDEEFKRILEQEGIPAHIASKTGYFAATEVQELLQALRTLDNPTQDIPLYGMMKSIFGGFTDEEIAVLRAGRKDCSLYEAMRNWTESGDAENAELKDRAASFLDKLRRYRRYTVYMPIRELLQKLVEEHDYLNYVTAMPAGGRRRANVEMLFTKASDFEKTSYFGLFHFVRYIEQLEKYDVDYGEADMLDENADVVRIMSIHKSKGLEFGVTFVAGLSKRFNLQDYSRAMITDMDLGLGVTYVNPKKRICNKTLRQRAIAVKMREENLAEELRVLYVALTRAREKLILTAALDDAEEKWDYFKEFPSEALDYSDFVEAGSFMDLLMPVLARTDFKVKIADRTDMEVENVKEQISLAVKLDALNHAGEYADEETAERLRERISFVYPYKSLGRLYTKTTVSELKAAAMADKDEAAFHAFEEREAVPYIPVFRKGKEKVSGTMRGNAFHRAMEIIDFDLILGGQFAKPPADYETYKDKLDADKAEESLADFLEREKKSLRFSEEYYNAVNIKKLVRFLGTEYAWRMWAAQLRGELYREQPFVLGIDAGRVSGEFPADERVLIQGIIDVFWVEDGSLVLLDYKTDIIDGMDELWKRYETQIEYYREALEELMGMPVKEKALYSFYLN